VQSVLQPTAAGRAPAKRKREAIEVGKHSPRLARVSAVLQPCQNTTEKGLKSISTSSVAGRNDVAAAASGSVQSFRGTHRFLT